MIFFHVFVGAVCMYATVSDVPLMLYLSNAQSVPFTTLMGYCLCQKRTIDSSFLVSFYREVHEHTISEPVLLCFLRKRTRRMPVVLVTFVSLVTRADVQIFSRHCCVFS